jgi:hypothetical protein
MAEYRIVYDDGKIVRFSYKDHAHGAKTRFYHSMWAAQNRCR